jgi:hypothetical protein
MNQSGPIHPSAFRGVILVRAVVRLSWDPCLRDHVIPVDPSSQVDQATAMGTEGKRRQVVERGDLVTTGTNGTSSSNHDSLLDVVAAGLADSEVEGLVEVDDGGSLDDFVDSVGGFSAWAAFLYDSLR